MKSKFNFLDNLIDYTFIIEDWVRQRLEDDNRKIEIIFLQGKSGNHSFISYCTTAFHQIENLINYYFWKKFPNYDDLLSELLTHNPNFQANDKRLEIAKSRYPKLNRLPINVLV